MSQRSERNVSRTFSSSAAWPRVIDFLTDGRTIAIAGLAFVVYALLRRQHPRSAAGATPSPDDRVQDEEARQRVGTTDEACDDTR